MLGGYLRSALAAALQWAAPARAARWPAPAPAEISPATREMLEQMRLPQLKAALVLSLWQAHPARQCAIAARYDFAEPELVIPAQAQASIHPSTSVVESAGAPARVLQQRLAMRFPAAAQAPISAPAAKAAEETARAAA